MFAWSVICVWLSVAVASIYACVAGVIVSVSECDNCFVMGRLRGRGARGIRPAQGPSRGQERPTSTGNSENDSSTENIQPEPQSGAT